MRARPIAVETRDWLSRIILVWAQICMNIFFRFEETNIWSREMRYGYGPLCKHPWRTNFISATNFVFVSFILRIYLICKSGIPFFPTIAWIEIIDIWCAKTFSFAFWDCSFYIVPQYCCFWRPIEIIFSSTFWLFSRAFERGNYLCFRSEIYFETISYARNFDDFFTFVVRM